MGRTLIAGPCSAESREQVLATAHALKDAGTANALRAGVWKPRTRAGGFEGHGEQALAWLKEAREETGLEPMTEVASPGHVAACVKAGIQTVWVGARTTANPFSVQELAGSLKDTGISVLVKNPISPDVELWLGAVERLGLAGVEVIGAIHRGFATGVASVYRNSPEWQIVTEFRKRAPGLPIICDPSHIAGKRSGVSSVAQRAMDLGLDGLMVEVHPDPESALTDAKQQLTPEDYSAMLSALQWRKVTQSDPLEALRGEIDRLDRQLLELVASRMEISKQIGIVKKDQGIEAYQPCRWSAVIESRVAIAEELGMNPCLAQSLFDQMHAESLRMQRLA